MLRTMFGRRLAWVLGAATTACGADAPVGPGTSESGGPSDSSTSAPGLACEDYRSATEIGPAVAVTVRHDGSQPAYFLPHGCAGVISFEVESLTDDVMVPNARGDCSPELCDDFMTATDCFPACPDCAPPGAGRIDPGATGSGTWTGEWLVPLEMNRDCVSDQSCEATCQRADQAPAGTYRIGLTVYRTCQGGCECEGDDDGVCNLFSGTFLGYPRTFVADISYPGETTAEIVIVD